MIKDSRRARVGFSKIEKSCWTPCSVCWQLFLPVYSAFSMKSICITFLCCFWFSCCCCCVHACGSLMKREAVRAGERCFGTCDKLFCGSLRTAAAEIFFLFAVQENCMQMWPSVKFPSSLQFGTVCSVFIHVTKWWCSTSWLQRFTGQWVFTMREFQFACRVLQRDYKMCSVMLIYTPFCYRQIS